MMEVRNAFKLEFYRFGYEIHLFTNFCAHTKGRMLSTQRKATKVACDQCQAYGCYKDDNADDDAEEEDRTEERTAEWITKLAECERFEDEDALWNGLELFYGAICNADGDGIEFATFLDEDCSIYVRQASFSTYYNATYEEEDGSYVDYASNAAEYIADTLSSTMPCSEYEAPQQDDGYGDEVEVNEYCEQLFKETAASINQCNATAEEDENQEYNDDDGFTWYSFDMTMEAADDNEQVCTKVRELNGNYFHAFKTPSSSGITYHVNKSVSNEWSELSSFEMSAFEIVLFTGAILAIAVCYCRRRLMQVMQPKKASVYKGDDIDTNLV